MKWVTHVFEKLTVESLPSRVRGLKLVSNDADCVPLIVAPFASSWIEIAPADGKVELSSVAARMKYYTFRNTVLVIGCQR